MTKNLLRTRILLNQFSRGCGTVWPFEKDFKTLLKDIFSKTPHSKLQIRESSDRVTFLVKKDVKKNLDIGREHLEHGRIKEAIEKYQEALEADAKCALTHFNIAYAYHEDGKHDEAKAQYEKAIELEPTCSMFLEHFGRLLFETQRFDESSQIFSRASMLGPVQPLSLGLWGRALYEQGLYEQSIEAFEQLVEKEKQPAIVFGANYWLAIIHAKQGRLAAARSITESLINQKEIDFKILYDLGEHFIEHRCLDLARKIFERIAIAKEEFLLARLRLEDIRSLEKHIEEMLPKIFEGDEEKMLHQIHALREFGSERISKALLSLIESPSALVRECVIRYQTEYGFNASNEILSLMHDPVAFVREAAYDYIVNLNNKNYLMHVLKGLNDPYHEIRRKAVRFIGRFGSIESLPNVEMALTDPENKTFQIDIKRAIVSIKTRYQKKIDKIYKKSAPQENGLEARSKGKTWKFWFLLLIQFTLIFYFLYVLIYCW